MKLSRREIIMLAVLFIIAIVFIEFRLIITPGIARVSKLSTEIVALEAEVDEINLNLASIDALSKKRDENLAKIETLSDPFINGIKPDVLLLFMHDLMKVNLFTPDGYNISTVEPAVLSPRVIEVYNLTYQLADLADQYQQLQNPDITEPEPGGQPSESSADGTVEQLSIHVTAIGSYFQITNLVSQIQGYERTMAITSLNLYYMDVAQLQLDMTVQFVGIQKLVPGEDDLATWTREPYDGGIEDPYSNTVSPTESLPVPSETTAAP